MEERRGDLYVVGSDVHVLYSDVFDLFRAVRLFNFVEALHAPTPPSLGVARECTRMLRVLFRYPQNSISLFSYYTQNTPYAMWHAHGDTQRTTAQQEDPLL